MTNPEIPYFQPAHTPGPWRLSQYFPNRVCGNRADDEGKFVADCDCNGAAERNQEDSANACLIAAAPDLLEAITRLSAQCDRMRLPGQSMSDAEKNARAVIAKATGAQA